MASLPSDRTKLALAQSNQNPGNVLGSSQNKNALTETYDTIDLLNQKVDSLVGATTLVPYPPAFLQRQAIINGNFDISQRGASFTVSPSYTLDRWQMLHNHTSVTITQQETFQPDGSRYNLRMTNTTRGAGTFFDIAQAIETKNCIALINKTVTLSFQIRKNSGLSAGSIVASIKYTTTVDDSTLNIVNGLTAGSVTVTSASMTTTHQIFTVSATIPSTARTVGVVLNLSNSPTDGGYVEIAQVQMNVGSQVLPFQPRSFAEELALCKRYYEILGSGVVGVTINATTLLLNILYSVEKRIAPTLVLTTSTPPITVNGSPVSGSGSTIGLGYLPATTRGTGVSINGFTGRTVGEQIGVNTSSLITADSEL